VAANYTLTGVVTGDLASLSLNDPVSGTYDTPNVGSAKSVSVTGLVLSGSAATNYALASTAISGSVGQITPLTISAGLTGTVSKTYDGTSTATLVLANYTLTGVLSGDVGSVSLNDPTSGTYNTPDVGSAKTVSVAGLALGGGEASNYTLASASISGPIGQITAATLTVSADAGQSKVYGTADPTFTYSFGALAAGDDSSVFTGALSRAPGETVLGGPYAILIGSLSAGPNYTIDFNGANFAITPATVTASLMGTVSKTYDGTSSATLATWNYCVSGVLTGDLGSVSLNHPVSGTYDTPNAGSGKTVSVTGLVLSGSAASNYTLASSTISGSVGQISPAPLTITANDASMIYGAVLPTLTASYSGFVNEETPANLSTPAVLTTSATSASPAGDYPILVSGATDPNYSISFVPGTLTIAAAETGTTIESSGSPTYYTSPVSFTATVTPSGGGTPTGSVDFYDGSVTPADLVDTETLSATIPDSATFTTSYLSVGVHTIYALYEGDGNFATSTTLSPASQTVNPLIATTTVVVTSGSPTIVGQSVTFTATVSSDSGMPTGTATLYVDGSQASRPEALSSGQASFSTSSLLLGSHTVMVQFNAGIPYASSSGALAGGQMVNPGVTPSITVDSNHDPAMVGQNVIFTATISGSAGTPTGTVTFFADGSQLGSVQSLSSGQASVSTSSLSVGTHSISVHYSGDGTYIAGSGFLSGGEVVNPVRISTSTKVKSSLDPSVQGQSVAFTATVTPSGSGTPTGTVSFYDNSTLLTTVALSGGAATYTTTKLSVGSHPITAVYSGDASFAGSTSQVLTQVVKSSSNSIVVRGWSASPVDPVSGQQAKPALAVRFGRSLPSFPNARPCFARRARLTPTQRVSALTLAARGYGDRNEIRIS
jgi:hypothetical protein